MTLLPSTAARSLYSGHFTLRGAPIFSSNNQHGIGGLLASRATWAERSKFSSLSTVRFTILRVVRDGTSVGLLPKGPT